MGQPEAIPSSSVPVWQNGTPQSMQRAPCSWSLASAVCSWNSCQSWTRSTGCRTSGNSRGNSRNPVGLPITRSRRESRQQLTRKPENLLNPFVRVLFFRAFVIVLLATGPRQVVRVRLEPRHDRLLIGQSLGLEAQLFLDHSAIIVRIDLHELWPMFLPL